MAIYNIMNGYLSIQPSYGHLQGTTIPLFEGDGQYISVLKLEAPLKENPQCGLNVAFDAEVTRSCDEIKNIIKLEATLWL